MGEAGDQHNVTRVLVALHASAQSLDAVDLAVALASRLQVELVALLVEKVNLLHLAALPVAREVNRISAASRQLDSLQMACALRAQAAQLRRVLACATAGLHLPSSLRVVRGEYVNEAMAAAADMDLLLLARAWQSERAYRRRSGALNRWLAEARRRRPVWVLYDGSGPADRVLALARDLTQGEHAEIVVALLAPVPDEAH
jgi:hypothetical protein